MLQVAASQQLAAVDLPANPTATANVVHTYEQFQGDHHFDEPGENQMDLSQDIFDQHLGTTDVAPQNIEL